MPCAFAAAHAASATHNATNLLRLLIFVPRSLGLGFLAFLGSVLRSLAFQFPDRKPFLVARLPTAEILEELEIRRALVGRRRSLLRVQRPQEPNSAQGEHRGRQSPHQPTPSSLDAGVA